MDDTNPKADVLLYGVKQVNQSNTQNVALTLKFQRPSR
jgi:hypothetical protein